MGPMLIYACSSMFKHWFRWKYQYNKYIFNCIDHLHFIPVSDCAGMGPSAMLWPGVYYAVKMPMNQIDNIQSEYESCTTHNQLYYISQMGSTKSQNHIHTSWSIIGYLFCMF